MLVVLALFLWLALSVPAAFFIGMLLAAHDHGRTLPFPSHLATSGHRLTRR